MQDIGYLCELISVHRAALQPLLRDNEDLLLSIGEAHFQNGDYCEAEATFVRVCSFSRVHTGAWKHQKCLNLV